MIKVICFLFVIYSLTVNQDGVGEQCESEVKAGKRKLYSVQFSRRGRLRRVQLWEPKRADDKSHLLFCCFSDIYSLTVNQDGVGERSESGVKAGKRKLYGVQFSRRGRLRR